MNPVIETQKPQIEALCRRYGVARLEIFGSANTPDFDPQLSDFDFVVALGDGEEDLVTRFVFFADDLEMLLGRSVDLVFESRLKPRFRETISASRETLYESENREIAA